MQPFRLKDVYNLLYMYDVRILYNMDYLLLNLNICESLYVGIEYRIKLDIYVLSMLHNISIIIYYVH